MINQSNFLKALIITLVIGSGAVLSGVNAKQRTDPAVAKLGRGFVSDTAKVNGTTLYYVRGGERVPR